MFKGFKEFIARGNVIDLAVAVVIGAAFGAVVTAVVENLFNPIIGALFNAKDLAGAFIIPLGGAQIKLGAVLAAVISFVLIALVVYFVFVMPMNKLKARADAKKLAANGPEVVPTSELDVLTEIRDLLAKQTVK
ncbi:MAG TPA: large conductance mechanosensitive channel protein MscL [Candidatus Lumbricidophila sp.]|nr:large conductance mechanosensitive channel protein MscL [Candidatus Lumbricidophila sp.]